LLTILPTFAQAELTNPSLVTAAELNSRPRGGFAFDLFSRDIQLGKALGLQGVKMPGATKTGY